MAKRIVTKIGDVFCAVLPGNKKAYFQYVANDLSQLNSSVIRVFRTHYPLDQTVSLKEIINDEIDFYAHTILRVGIDVNAWTKVGKDKNINEKEIENVIFGTAQPFECASVVVLTDPTNNWYVWHINGVRTRIGTLPENLHDIVYPGAVLTYKDVLNRMYYGYYLASLPEYTVLKRIPRADVHSYVHYSIDGLEIYLCYRGDNWEKGVIVNGNIIKRIVKGEENDVKKGIIRAVFSDNHWIYRNFISQQEFDEQWKLAGKRTNSLKTTN